MRTGLGMQSITVSCPVRGSRLKICSGARFLGAALLVAVGVLPASAQPVLITSPATINPSDGFITPTAGGPAVPLATADITVRGTTLTVNGRHTIRNLFVESNGTVTHAASFTFDYSGGAGTDVVNGMWLNVQANPGGGNVVVDATSRIDVTSKGFGPALGPGAGASTGIASTYASGASHGGSGVASAAGPSGSVYGSQTMPITFGSGGGSNPANGAVGGPGGGVVRLNVDGTLTVNGLLHANGAIGVNNTGSGAGGSIVIDAGTLSGNGQIWARGGDSWFGDRPAGGGGRIAFLRSSSGFTGSILANGGSGNTNGGPGTVYYEAASPRPRLVYRNVVPGETLLNEELAFDGDLFVQESTTLSHPAGIMPGLSVIVTGDLSIDVTSRIDASGKGFPSGEGPGAGTASWAGPMYASAGSHGGSGVSSTAGPAGVIYGSATMPTTFGSGGGANPFNNAIGGAGGGMVRLLVGGTLSVTGRIYANGAVGVNNAGSGAGGSIVIDAGTLAGNGQIWARGGDSWNGDRSAGGGGRIAFLRSTSGFTGSILANGGSGSTNGGPGTVYYEAATPRPRLVYRSVSPGTNTYDEPFEFDGDVLLQEGTIFTHPAGVMPGLLIDVGGNLTVDVTSRIDASGKGFPSGEGPGAGIASWTAPMYASAGSHGGSGGSSAAGPAGVMYGSPKMPTTFGSGGGANPFNNALGGAGGGVVRVQVGGTLSVTGRIYANGAVGVNNAGSGAGGSIVIDAGTLSGNGQIWARGGDSWNGDRSAGGGGRIAFLRSTSGFTGSILANGGTGSKSGGPGTVYYEAATPRPRLVYRSVSPGTNTYDEPFEFDGDVLLQEGTVFTHPAGVLPGLRIDVSGDLNIDVTSSLDVTGRGFAAVQGPGAGVSTGDPNTYASGGGHGGRGANTAAGPGGGTYGSAQVPVTFGSGGGSNTGQSTSGGAGGGAMHVVVGGVLTMNGQALSNGVMGVNNTGSGAGGSILIEAASLVGSGFVWARGGNGWSGDRAAGGGGRVAVYACAVSLPLDRIDANAGTGSRPGEIGTRSIDTDGMLVISEPDSSSFCAGPDFEFAYDVFGATSFQWTRNGVPLVDGPTGTGSTITGSSGSTLTVQNGSAADAGVYRAIASSACGSLLSEPAVLDNCLAEYNCDGVVDILDFLDFMDDFGSCTNQPVPCGQFGTPDLNGDTFVDIVDFLDFMDAFSRGC